MKEIPKIRCQFIFNEEITSDYSGENTDQLQKDRQKVLRILRVDRQILRMDRRVLRE